MENLLPTPAKSHYTFNLRDFSRVIQGCLLIKKESLENKGTMIRLFVHEVFRVYYDRLVDDNDRAWLYQLISGILKDHFKASFEQLFDHLKQGSKVSYDPVRFAVMSCAFIVLSYHVSEPRRKGSRFNSLSHFAAWDLNRVSHIFGL